MGGGHRGRSLEPSGSPWLMVGGLPTAGPQPPCVTFCSQNPGASSSEAGLTALETPVGTGEGSGESGAQWWWSWWMTKN